jgi:hypothetical protein
MYNVPANLVVCNALFCIYAFCIVLTVNSINQLIFVTVKCGVLFEVRTGFLNIIKSSVGFKGLMLL